MIKTERNSAIELARIIAMLLILFTHFFQQGRIVTSVVPEDRFTLLCLSNGGRIAVNLFVLISCYFMVEKKQHIGTRWLRTYIPLFFYSATITTILLLMGFLDERASAIEIFRCYFPFFGRPLWFVSAYLMLLLAVPFLLKVKENVSSKLVNGFIIVTTTFLWINCAWGAVNDNSNSNFMLDTFWFLLLFLIIGQIKTSTSWFSKANRWICLCTGIGLYTFLNLAQYYLYCQLYPSVFLSKIVNFCLSDFKGPINFIIAFTIFTFFVKTEIKSNSIINALAAPTLAIYIIHQQPLFYNYLWFEILNVNAWRGGPYTLLLGIVLTIVLYLALAGIEYIRRLAIDSWLLKTKLFSTTADLIDKLLGTK